MLAGWVADQHPADRDRRDAGVIPKRGAGGDQQRALLVVVLLSDDHARPDRLLVPQHGAQIRQGPPLQRGAAPLTRPTLGRWPEQIGVYPQPGDHANMVTDSGQQIKRCKAAVGNEDQTSVGQPASGL